MNGAPRGARVRRRIIVRGRVQGVFFRESTRRLAQAHGVAGWVRNNADGTVEATFEGAREAVERVVAFCRSGPSEALVEHVEVFEEAPEGMSGFTVR
ncbi:MAG: acylphosphatase [Actinobacteria bacterium]|nr:acylphosphatase [Actinomycetota bacterium]